MKILRITNVRDFMNQMLRSELFDHFLLSEAMIQNRVTYMIDGHIKKTDMTEEEIEMDNLTGLDCAPFSLLRNSCYEMIKGKRTPASFKFVFMLSPDNLARTLASAQSDFTTEDLNAVFLNIRYQEGILTCTSGVSYRTFSLDHSFEHIWDSLAERFLSSHNISFTDAD